MMGPSRYDIAIVGAGIVGLATALVLRERHEWLRLAVLEKEATVGCHQTGHNSGVIHSGIYYAPGSLKARLCVEGVHRLMAFCDAHQVRYERCGKVIVASSERELGTLEELYQRGVANGVSGLRKIGPQELREIEPHATGIAALHSPNTAIVDYREVAMAMVEDIYRHGGEVLTGRKVVSVIEDGQTLRLLTTGGEIAASYLINCAGLYADIVAQKMGTQPNVRIVPFRGEYYMLQPERQHLIQGLIYPVPNPRFPFLGAHFTRTVHGEVEVGPNAVLAFAREGYTKSTVNWQELLEIVTYRGFWRLGQRYWPVALSEFYRSFDKIAFVKSLQRLVPAIQADDLVASDSGVRAQAVAADGCLVDDFLILASSRAIHVLNAPSPAATASLAIGDYIAATATKSFGWEQPVNKSKSRSHQIGDNKVVRQREEH
jgi:L-2-hydroxyglutarate oxidase